MAFKLPPGVIIAEERPWDGESVGRVNRAAFESEYEALLVDRLRERCPGILSLVARKGDQVVGHVLFSPVRIRQGEGQDLIGRGLGPLSVLPDRQGQGIGSALCREGLQRMKAAGHPFVVVLGHSGYYPRFGFTKASQHGIRCAFENVPDEAFMICILKPASMKGVSGVAYYRPEFDETA